MGEIKPTVDTEEVDDEKKEDASSGASESDSEEDSEDLKDSEGDKPEEKPEEPEEFKDDGEEPLTRHEKNKRYAQMRIAKKEAKKEKEPEEDDFSNDSEDGESSLTPEEERLFDKYIEKKGILDKVSEIDDKQELINFNEFMLKEENKIFAPYKDKIWRFSQHKDRKNLPFSTIAWEVAGPHLLKIGANMQKEADKKAKENSSGGTQNNKVDTGRKPVEKMTDAEFQQYLSDIKSGNITK